MALTALAAAGAPAVERTLQRMANRYVNRRFVNLFGYLELDPELGWTNKKSYRADWLRFGQSYQLDSNGERIGPVPGTRPEAAARTVWILGDSSPFGFGVDGRRIFAERIRLALAPERVLVRNLAVVGYNSRQMRQKLALELRRGRDAPNVLVIWGGFNDTEYTHRLIWRLPFIERLSLLNYRIQMSRILRLCRSRGVKVILMTLPSLENYPPIAPINAWIRSRAAASPDIAVVDVQKSFEDINGRELYTGLDDRRGLRYHPSAKGHGIVFKMLLPMVRALLPPV